MIFHLASDGHHHPLKELHQSQFDHVEGICCSDCSSVAGEPNMEFHQYLKTKVSLVKLVTAAISRGILP